MILILIFSYLPLICRPEYKHILPFEAIKCQSRIFPYKQIGEYKYISAPKIFPKEDEW